MKLSLVLLFFIFLNACSSVENLPLPFVGEDKKVEVNLSDIQNLIRANLPKEVGKRYSLVEVRENQTYAKLVYNETSYLEYFQFPGDQQNLLVKVNWVCRTTCAQKIEVFSEKRMLLGKIDFAKLFDIEDNKFTSLKMQKCMAKNEFGPQSILGSDCKLALRFKPDANHVDVLISSKKEGERITGEKVATFTWDQKDFSFTR